MWVWRPSHGKNGRLGKKYLRVVYFDSQRVQSTRLLVEIHSTCYKLNIQLRVHLNRKQEKKICKWKNETYFQPKSSFRLKFNSEIFKYQMFINRTKYLLKFYSFKFIWKKREREKERGRKRERERERESICCIKTRN